PAGVVPARGATRLSRSRPRSGKAYAGGGLCARTICGAPPLVAFGCMTAASRRFYAWLGLVAVGAASWRTWYILGPVRNRIHWPALSDEWFYHRQAQLSASGRPPLGCDG